MKTEEAPGTIMIIDDTPANLRLLQAQFHASGYNIMTFTRGAEALEAASLNLPDIILLDIKMPEMNGFEVCERLKKDDVLKDIPVLFISALSEANDKVKAFEAGGVDYITKPFQMEEVRARVETHLELKKQERILKKAYKELAELEQVRDEFVHMLVHDLRSPLAGLQGIFQLLETDKEEADEFIREGKHSTERMIQMISTILDVSRMESNKLNPLLSRVDLHDLINNSAGSIAALKENRTLTVTLPGTNEAIYCDADLIARVMQNLITNAIQHTNPEKGIIDIVLKNETGCIRISVKDNGMGISEEDLEKVFDKFRQTSGKRYSTGLGLTFCKLAVEAHGGEIGVDSRQGKGSTFWFIIPKERMKPQDGQAGG